MPETGRRPMHEVVGFRSAYVAALSAFLDDGSERTLQAAYELGRSALSRGVGLLELAHTHHDAVQAALGAAEHGDAPRVAAAAGDFLLEALGAYEMVHRGFGEAQETVAYERRQAAMIRRLSTLLADASLALHAHGSLEEMLRLVVEQARELTAAAWCLAHTHKIAAGRPVIAEVDAGPDDEAATLDTAYAALASTTHAGSRAYVEFDESCVAVPFEALDGETVGVLAAAPTAGRQFTELDHALLVHVGQMAAAALERAMRYRLNA